MHHEELIRIRRYSHDLNGSRRKIDDEERVVRYEALCRPNLGGEEVRGGDGRRVRLDKRAPRRSLAALRSRIDTGVLQRTLDRVGADNMPDVLECSLDSVVAPGRVLIGELHGKGSDGFHEPDAGGVRFRLVGPLRRDQVPMPSQDRLGLDDDRVLLQQFPPHGQSEHSELGSVCVSQDEPALHAGQEKHVDCPGVFNRGCLLTAEPTGEHEGKGVHRFENHSHGLGMVPRPTSGVDFGPRWTRTRHPALGARNPRFLHETEGSDEILHHKGKTSVNAAEPLRRPQQQSV